MSRAQVNRLGDRLRGEATPAPSDLDALEQLLLAHQPALAAVAYQLRGIGLAPTTRLKTSGTLLDKLKRETTLPLSTVRDLAGARIVQPMNLTEQDRLVERIAALWPDRRIIDRRATPNYGYRAVHVIAKVEDCRVEIQVRTRWQDLWAQVSEQMGDMYGRQIRYGGPPVNPTDLFGDGPMTVGEVVDTWRGPMSEYVAWAERAEADLAQLEWLAPTWRDPTPEDDEDLQQIRDDILEQEKALARARELFNGMLEALAWGADPGV